MRNQGLKLYSLYYFYSWNSNKHLAEHKQDAPITSDERDRQTLDNAEQELTQDQIGQQ